MKLGQRSLNVGVWENPAASPQNSQPPVVICNGLGINMDVLSPLAGLLDRRTVLAIDPPGIGRSPEPWLPYSAGMAAGWIAQLLDQMQIEQADLLGFSWGGAIAQQFAIQHKCRLRRLAVAAIGPGWPMIPGKASILSGLTDPAWLGQLRDDPRRAAFLGIGKADAKALTADFLERLILPRPRGYFFQMAALAGWTSALALPLLDRPVLVVAGENDEVVPPANARLLAALVPHARLEIVKGAGHLLMFSHPEEFSSLLRSFLASDKHEMESAA